MVSTVVKTWLFFSSVLFVTCLKTIIGNLNMIELQMCSEMFYYVNVFI